MLAILQSPAVSVGLLSGWDLTWTASLPSLKALGTRFHVVSFTYFFLNLPRGLGE